MAKKCGKRLKLRKTNKGSLQDIGLIAGIALFIAITVLLGFTFMSKLNDQIQTMDAINNTEARASSQKLTNFYPSVIDNSILFLVVGLCIVTLIFAVFVKVHPVFIPLFIIAWVLVIFFSGVLSNIYQKMAATSMVSAYAEQLVFISNILEFLPLLIGIFGILLMVVMYKVWGAD